MKSWQVALVGGLGLIAVAMEPSPAQATDTPEAVKQFEAMLRQHFPSAETEAFFCTPRRGLVMCAAKVKHPHPGGSTVGVDFLVRVTPLQNCIR